MSTSGSLQPANAHTPPSYQDRYVQLFREITRLQWVRESLPVQSRYYEGLKQRLQRERHLKALQEKQLDEYRKKRDTQPSLLQRGKRGSSSGSIRDEQHEPSYTSVIGSLRHCEADIEALETQLESVKGMMNDLMTNMRKLENLCSQMHELYDEIVSDETEDDPACVMERRLRTDVLSLVDDIPKIEASIRSFSDAQVKLYEARDRMEEAMKSLPGASTFMDRQAMVGQAGLFGKHNHALASLLDVSVPSLKESERLAQVAYQLEAQASELCADVPLIPTSPVGRDEDVMNVLTSYRGYRLKIEATLRQCVNPRLRKLQSELAISKFHYEQKNIEWIDQQIVTLENVLRRNGCLADENLEREISMLRMGSSAAIAAVGAETSGRTTVDDVLDVNPASLEAGDHGQLPQYSEGCLRRQNGTSPSAYYQAEGDEPPAYS